MPSPDEPRYDVLHPRGRAEARDWLRPALVPASWLYRAGAAAVRRARGRGRTHAAAGAAVISVGNLEVGGSGKTPVCLHFLSTLGADGRRVAYVSRGYRSRAERFDGVTVVAGEESAGPGSRWVSRGHVDLASEVGDEGAMVALEAPGASLVFARDKARALEVALALVGDGVVVLDDAFQSWRVHRDVDVVLLDAARPFGDGRLLPAGTLREAPSALARADVLLFNGASSDDDVRRAADVVRRRTGLDLPAAGVRRTLCLERPLPRPVAVVSAIARPESFEGMLTRGGWGIGVALRYPDHHAYTAADVLRIRRAARDHGCGGIVTTAKDHVKLKRLGLGEDELFVARLDVALTDETVVTERVKPRTRSAASP